MDKSSEGFLVCVKCEEERFYIHADMFECANCNTAVPVSLGYNLKPLVSTGPDWETRCCGVEAENLSLKQELSKAKGILDSLYSLVYNPNFTRAQKSIIKLLSRNNG